MRKVILVSLAVAAFGQIRSCGNCRGTGEFDGRCNSGSPDLVPYNVTNTADPANGVNQAEAVTIGEIQTTVGEAWRTMFCSSFLGRYKDGFGSLAGEGAACVRSFNAASILAADKEAKDAYNKFGTTNGYASSFAVSKGSPMPQDLQTYGTDGTGDVPANWCGVYMKEMVCAIAFPQVVMEKAALVAARVSGPFNARSTDVDTHYVRSVERGSCDTLFDVCNRREPTTDETKEGFQPVETDSIRAMYFLSNNTRRKLESDAFCAMWEDGFGLSAAGNGVADGSLLLTFEAGSTLVASMSALLAMVAVMLL